MHAVPAAPLAYCYCLDDSVSHLFQTKDPLPEMKKLSLGVNPAKYAETLKSSPKATIPTLKIHPKAMMNNDLVDKQTNQQ